METQPAVLDGQSRDCKPISPELPGDEQSLLLAEDPQSENLLIEHAFGAAGMGAALHVVSDGETAIDYLSGSGNYGNRLTHPMPKVVLLDLHPPGKDGFEVLSWMRMQSHFQSLIIVIFTALNREADADRARAMGADFYLTKPNSFDELVKMTRCLYGWVLGSQGLARNS